MNKKYYHTLAEGAETLETREFALDSMVGLTPNRVVAEVVNFKGRNCLEVKYLPGAPVIVGDPPDFAYFPEIDLQDGLIEVDVAGDVASDAPELARGFVGVAFRITPDFVHEGLYIRPANGRAEDQVRRNHSCQYYAYPDFPWNRLRSEEPEKYESYVDLEMNAWTHLRIELRGARARLYVHGNEHPTLVVNDMKLGSSRRGYVGLWIAVGTIAHFSNLKITKWK